MSPTRLLVPPLGVGLVAGGVAAMSAGGQAAAPPTGTLTLTVASNDNNGSFVDLPPKSRKAPSNGDEFFGRGTVTGDAQGTADFSVTFIGKKGFLRGAVSLPGGRLFFEELTSEAKVVRGAIIGGTGSYAGARGDFEDRTLKSTKTTTTTRVTISFVG